MPTGNKTTMLFNKHVINTKLSDKCMYLQEGGNKSMLFFIINSIELYNSSLCVCVQSVSHIRLFRTLYDPVRVLCPWDFPSKNNGIGCHFLLQRVFLAQGWNSHLLHCRQISLLLSQWGIQLHSIPYVYVYNFDKHAKNKEGREESMDSATRLPGFIPEYGLY